MAASSFRLRDMRSLDESNISHIVTLPKSDGRKSLAKALGWKVSEIDEERDLRDAVHLDFLYGVIEFCAKKGFTYPQICFVFYLAQEFFSVALGSDLPQAIKLYREKVIQCGINITEENLKIFTNFLFSTYMVHVRLYQHVFTQEREPFTITAVESVQPPVDVTPLKEGVPEHVWEYEQRLQAIAVSEKTRRDDLQALKEDIKTQMLAETENIMEKLQGPLNREEISIFIKEAAESHSKQVEKLLNIKVEEKHEDLNFYFEKTSLPRPAELGPPPRTKVPPGSSAKSRISTKGGKNASAKSSKQVKSSKR